MTDIFNKEKRSKVMTLVKGKNTKPEIILRKKLHALGFRFRVHDRKLPGTPDVKLTKYKTVVFVNGCFWHGHLNCKYYTVPKSNHQFWVDKIEKNINRDRYNYKKLVELGWKVLVIWACELNKKRIDLTINYIAIKLRESK
ncbi:MAG: vsr [Mucilaginibacter sp.]|jgi:DNA mismatch endonuclease (patch repair protein)|nr:vsr [Mucilaginibacter sp.]